MSATKRLSKFIAILLCVVTVFCGFGVEASARTWGHASTERFHVTTKANYWYPGKSSITLSQSKQTFTYKSLFGKKEKVQKGYFGCYTITVEDLTKWKTKKITWNGGRTKKINLDPNRSYVITVSYNSLSSEMLKKAPLGYSLSNASSPSWEVASKCKVSSCW